MTVKTMKDNAVIQCHSLTHRDNLSERLVIIGDSGMSYRRPAPPSSGWLVPIDRIGRLQSVEAVETALVARHRLAFSLPARAAGKRRMTRMAACATTANNEPPTTR